MKDVKVILRDIHPDCQFGRQVCLGIDRYAGMNQPWLFVDMDSSRKDNVWLRHAGAVGVISMRRPRDYGAAARRYGLAAVGVGAWAPGSEFSGLPYVDVDPKAIGEMAADYFVNRGFRNFGMIALEKRFHSRYRGEAFVAALKRRKLPCDVFDPKKRYPQAGEPLESSRTAEWIHRWLAGLPKPAAVFCMDDSVAVWVCGVCWQTDINVPEEVAILGADDDYMFCSTTYPRLSSIAVPAEQVGYEAARILDLMIRGRKPPKRPILLPPKSVITRQSTDVMAMEDRYVAEAVRFIREHAHEGIGVADVLAESRLSRRMLERRFRKAMGRGLFAEIRRVQIEHLKMLLAQTDKTLEAAADECGFKSVARMSVLFKKTTGKTPGTWRKQFRNH